MLTVLVALAAMGKDYRVTSPDGKLLITVHADSQRLTWEVTHGNTTVLTPSEIAVNGPLKKLKGRISANTITVGNGRYSVTFRADNDAAAYRIGLTSGKPATISSETAEFHFAA